MNRTVGHILSIILFTTFTIITCQASEQTPELDHKQLYDRASQLMAEGNLSEAQLCFDKAFAIPDIEHSPIYPLLLNEQATLMTWRGERRDAIDAKRSVIPYLDSFGDKELDISVYSDLGILYHRSNMTDSAIYFHEKADSVARVFGDPGWQASVTHNIGVMYYNLRRFNDAAQYLERAAQYAINSNDTYSIICARQLLSVAETERGNIEEAGVQARMAWNDALALDDKSLQLRCIPSLYRYFEAAGRNDSVDRYMDIGYDLYSQLPQNSVISLGYVMARARMHYNRHQWDKALHWYEIQEKSPMQSNRAALLSHIGNCYRHLGRYEDACRYLDSARIYTDSIANMNAAARLEEFNIKYNALEREMENSTLRMNVLKRDRILLAVALIIAILAVMSMVLYRSSRKARSAMEEMERRRQLETAQHYIQGLEDERKYFAKELHDGVANDLLGLKMKLYTHGDDPRSVEKMIDNTRETVRRIAHELMPPEFDRLSLSEILSYYTSTLSTNSGTDITYTSTGIGSITPSIGRELYRITQEHLMNLLQHGNATHISINITNDHPDKGTLTITDNSTTTPPDQPSGTGIGLRTIADRAKAIGAQIHRNTGSDNLNTFTLIF